MSLGLIYIIRFRSLTCAMQTGGMGPGATMSPSTERCIRKNIEGSKLMRVQKDKRALVFTPHSLPKTFILGAPLMEINVFVDARVRRGDSAPRNESTLGDGMNTRGVSIIEYGRDRRDFR